MKTFADFKRSAIVGAKFKRVFLGNMPKDTPPEAVRIVNHVQSNAIAFEVDKGDGKSWFYWPKKGQYVMDGDKLVMFDTDMKPRMSLELIP